MSWRFFTLPFAGAALWLLSASPGLAACELFSEPQRFNTSTSEDVIVIGHQQSRRYHLVLPRADEAAVSAIQACILDAFLTRSRSGEYLQIGSFERRSEAETIRRILRRSGYRPRVVYNR
ncbi:MAG: hypothetical protein AAFO83_10675 [Cyanobacteria bacterium J06607_13]